MVNEDKRARQRRISIDTYQVIYRHYHDFHIVLCYHQLFGDGDAEELRRVDVEIVNERIEAERIGGE